MVAILCRDDLNAHRHAILFDAAWQRDRGQAERIGERRKHRMAAWTDRVAINVRRI